MAEPFRVATFNCENLFSRPKIFNETPARAEQLLSLVDDLRRELQQDPFDKDRIAQLKEQLDGYAHVVDVRGHHMSLRGPRFWVGTVELTRERYRVTAVDNTARVIRDLRADVLCLIEVENRLHLKEFHDDVLVSRFLAPLGIDGYEHVLLFDGNDNRGIDVSALSRLPVQWMRTHVHDRTQFLGAETATFSRDCFVVRLRAPDGKSLTLLVNHLKSMREQGGPDPNGHLRRLGQATRLAEILDEFDLQSDYVIVAGDLNSEPSSPSLLPLLTKPGLYNVNLELAADERGTYTFDDRDQQLDYLLISAALRSRLQSVEIERRGIFSTNRPHYPEVESSKDQASDHAAVVAEFQL